MHPEVPIERILIAIDFSASAERAFYAGVSLATRLEAETWVLHVSEPIRAFDFGKKRYIESADTIERVEEGLRSRLEELWGEGGLEAVDRRRVHLIVRGGKAAAEIVATARAKEVDLILLGSSEQNGAGALLGSTSERVFRSAHCSVLCIRRRNGDSQTLV